MRPLEIHAPTRLQLGTDPFDEAGRVGKVLDEMCGEHSVELNIGEWAGGFLEVGDRHAFVLVRLFDRLERDPIKVEIGPDDIRPFLVDRQRSVARAHVEHTRPVRT
jgi:hypothetical protein